MTVSGTEYHKLFITDYIHGYTETVGSPQVPLKGLLIDLPEDATASVAIESLETSTYDGYRIYPAPRYQLFDDDPSQIEAAFCLNEGVYDTDAFSPFLPVTLGETAYFREQKKAQLRFYPLQYNPVTGELTVHTLMRVRVVFDYPHAAMALTGGDGTMAASPWSPDSDSPVYKIQIPEEGITLDSGQTVTAYELRQFKQLLADTVAPGAVLYQVAAEEGLGSAERNELVKQLLATSPPTGYEVHVAGESAFNHDLLQQISDWLPWVFVWIVFSSFSPLMALLRSFRIFFAVSYLFTSPMGGAVWASEQMAYPGVKL